MEKKKTAANARPLERLGNYLDDRLNVRYHARFEAPELMGRPQKLVWYRIPLKDGMSGDGSEYHMYLKRGTNRNLCIFFSGGGVAWNEYTAARPVTGGKVAARLPNFYWNNLRPFTEIYNIHNGIMQIGNSYNPFNDWNTVVIPYATGDMHIGNNDFPYEAEDGSEQVLHFHGYRNFQAAMQVAVSMFRHPKRLLIAGDSAGAFAVPALTTPVLTQYYPDCRNVTVFSDSAQLLYRKWRTTARDVWKADQVFWGPIKSSNMALDWYRTLYDTWGDSLHYLYAGSPRDYLLSAYYNDVVNGKYKTNLAVQEQYQKQMKKMLAELKQITPKFGFFLYPFKTRTHIGGTVHTAVRHHWFYHPTPSGISMAEWLGDAEKGMICDLNMELMERA
ncbi:MAG: pectin acetylesterase [Eubacterium sp.]|nr:pectin acetylesterase [Eubacterium sp.]